MAPTPVIAYLTKLFHYDFGVVISASHNPKNYNGIKIFDSEGFKIKEELEGEIERKILYSSEIGYDKVGRYSSRPQLIKFYKNNILKNFSPLDGVKVVLDLANGASYSIAKELFSKLGARVIALNNGKNGKKINVKCGALYPETLAAYVKYYSADMGFSFDGDADRIIACDEKGNILDGDDILFLLAKFIRPSSVVGTSMTNKGLEVALANQGINLLRADVGDKYVVEMMKNKNSPLGGEPSGHIINFNYSTTGDGVLTALTIASFVKKENKSLSKLVTLKHYPQIIINVEVIDKYRILNSDLLSAKVIECQKLFGQNGRVLVRASGTESKIRVMCEHKNKELAENWAKIIENLIKNIEKDYI